MEGRKYRIIISNKRIYKEIQLAADMTGLYIGTVKGCEIRFSKELFFEDVKIMLEKRQDSRGAYGAYDAWKRKGAGDYRIFFQRSRQPQDGRIRGGTEKQLPGYRADRRAEQL